MAYWEYAPYVSVGERKAKAMKKVAQLKKKNPKIKPVTINGTALAKTWWGKSWNKNLERYADYSNRIGRGRSYVRHGAVLDLQIMPGKIKALVQGSRSKPYQVDIQIKPLNKVNWLRVKTVCGGKLDTLQKLLSGQFPKELADTFMAQDKGLFPTPDEIEFDCSCPDWADMCKHVAATLYGIGARLDENPALFFELRKVNINDLITQAVETKTKNLLDRAKKKSSRVMEDSDLGDIFGIVMEKEVDFKKTLKPVKEKKTGNIKLKKNSSPTKPKFPKINKSQPPKSNLTELEAIKRDLKKATQQMEMANQELKQVQSKNKIKFQKPIDQVAEIIKNSKSGINVNDLSLKAGIKKSRLYSLVHRLKQQGKIKNKSAGVYIKNR